MRRLCLYTFVLYCAVIQSAHGATALRENCVDCMSHHIVNLDDDYNKVKADPELSKYVAGILSRLKTFKVPVHPRIRIFYELLKIGMNEYAQRTADSLYVPDKYNVALGKKV